MQFERKEDTLIVYPEGQIHFENSNIMKETIKGHIHDSMKYLILDMQKVEFIDSSGAGMLISLLKFMRQKNGTVALRNLQKEVAFVIKISKLDYVFEILDTTERAM